MPVRCRHDNLYALLRGRKRFALYAPSDAPRLYPNGVLRRVHANGRINYEGAPSRADGADAHDAARVAGLDAANAQAALAAAEAAQAAGAPGARRARRKAEAALEAALQDALRAQALAGGGESGSKSGDGLAADGNSEGASGSEGAAWCGVDDYCDSDVEGAADAPSEGDADDGVAPPHFSRVDTQRPGDFPLFAAAQCVTADVAAGELLFLPAGWFHEVTSFSAAADAADAAGAGASADASAATHLAVNYWFHPPDTDSFEAPYSSDLWARDFAAWQRDILPTLLAPAPDAAAADAAAGQ
jgi:hypothetical protein